MSYNNHLPVVYCCYAKHGGFTTNLTLRNHWGMLLMCQNTTMWVYGAWIKTYYVLCSKAYNTFSNVLESVTSSQQAARSARICETRLCQQHNLCSRTILVVFLMFTQESYWQHRYVPDLKVSQHDLDNWYHISSGFLDTNVICWSHLILLKMVEIVQTAFFNASSWIKLFESPVDYL